MAQSIALAVLEYLVHMTRQDYPTGYVVITAQTPDDVKILGPELFSESDVVSTATERQVGDAWLRSGASVSLRVPSASVRDEWNYLLNPEHSEFARIEVAPPVTFTFDQRLFI